MACALAVGSPGRAAAQVGWGTSPERISAIHSAGVNMLAPKLGIDVAGNAVAVWVEIDASGWNGVLRAARYDRTTRSWGTRVSLSDGTTPISDLRIAVDAAGDAVATWTDSAFSSVSKARAARYAATTGVWTSIPIAGVITGKVIGAVNAAGDAVIVWNELTGVGFTQVPVSLHAMRYFAATATWSAVEPLAAALPAAPVASDVGIDGAGNVFVVWLGQSRVQATRFAAATGSWSGVVDLSAPLVNLAVSPPDLATNDAGDALVSWSRIDMIEAARWPAGGSAWSPPAPVAATTSADMTRTALDSAGNGMVLWTSNDAGRQLWAARYNASSTTWAPATALTAGAYVLGFPSVALDGSGNAFVAWTQSPASGVALVYSSRQAAATGAWTTSPGLSPAGELAYNPDIAADLDGNALMVWHQTAGAVASTLALGWEATLAAPSLTAVAPGPGPGTLSVTFALPLASDPAFAATNLQYSLDGGGTWITRAPAATGSPLEIAGLTDTVTYGLVLRAVNRAGAGEPSASRPVRSGGDPTDFRVVARSGNLVTFAWVAPAGLAPTSYLLEGWVEAQPQARASLPTGGTATQLTLAVPSGVFVARVVAIRGATHLGMSPELRFSVNAPGVDNASTSLLGSANGNQLSLSWTNVANGAPLTGVRLHIGGSVVTGVDLPLTEHFTFDHAPPGTYTFTVSPLVGPAAGAPSNVVTLTFPGACAGPPNPPTAFSASTQGGRVYLDWSPPAGGAAATSYVVQVTGAFTGSTPVTARTHAVPAPPGSYTVGVMSVGPCGTSAATTPQTVVVP